MFNEENWSARAPAMNISRMYWVFVEREPCRRRRGSLRCLTA